MDHWDFGERTLLATPGWYSAAACARAVCSTARMTRRKRGARQTGSASSIELSSTTFLELPMKLVTLALVSIR